MASVWKAGPLRSSAGAGIIWTLWRVGTETAVKLMERDTWDERLLVEFGCAMSDASICGLG